MDQHPLCHTKTTGCLRPTALRRRKFSSTLVSSFMHNLEKNNLSFCQQTHHVFTQRRIQACPLVTTWCLETTTGLSRADKRAWIDEEQKKEIPQRVRSWKWSAGSHLWLDHLLRLWIKLIRYWSFLKDYALFIIKEERANQGKISCWSWVCIDGAAETLITGFTKIGQLLALSWPPRTKDKRC